FYVLSALTALVTLICIGAARFSLQRRVEAAVYLLIFSLILFFPFATAFISGIGLALGVSGLVGVFMLATLTLNQPQANRVIVIGIILGIALITVDAFYPAQRLEVRLLTVYTPIIAAVALAIVGYYISREFSNYPLRTKLILLFIIVAVFS